MVLTGAVLVAVLAAYAVWANRKRQVYQGRIAFDVPAHQLFALLRDGAGGRAFGSLWERGAWRYEGRWVECDPEQRRLIHEAALGPEGQAPLDRQWAEVRIETLRDGRSCVRVRLAYACGDGPGFWQRLRYPWTLAAARRVWARAVGEHYRAVNGRGSSPGTQNDPFPRLVLIVAAIAWYGTQMGVEMAIGLVAGIWIHEYGHVRAMRHAGMEAPRILMVPAMGGLALGSRPYSSEREHVFISLAGPALGYMSGLACYLFAWIVGSQWYPATDFAIDLGYILVWINLVNLMPLYPLDGSHVMLAITRGRVNLYMMAVTLSIILWFAFFREINQWEVTIVGLLFLNSLLASMQPRFLPPLTPAIARAALFNWAGWVMLHVATLLAPVWMHYLGMTSAMMEIYSPHDVALEDVALGDDA